MNMLSHQSVVKSKRQATSLNKRVGRLRVLVVDEELPFPANSGKRIRSFELLRRLAERHDITLLAHRNTTEAEEIQADKCFREIGIKPIVMNRSVPAKRGFRFNVRLALNLFSPLPYSVWIHATKRLQRVVREETDKGRYDLVHCEWTPYVEAMRFTHGVPVVASAHNIESQIWQRYYECQCPGLKRRYIRHQWRKFQTFEKWAFTRADHVVFVSDEDEKLGALHYGAKHSSVVENGVDLNKFTPVFHGRDSSQVLMLGSLDWRPNIDGIEQFLKIVLPQVRAVMPALRVVVVGRNPDAEWAEWVRSHEGVSLHANVPDVRPYLERSGCLVVPLRIGGGSRLKILEAAASGLPVVSTAIGAEGLAFKPGVHFTATPCIEEMACALLDVVQDRKSAHGRAVAASKVIEERYGWDALAERLDTCWRDCATRQRQM